MTIDRYLDSNHDEDRHTLFFTLPIACYFKGYKLRVNDGLPPHNTTNNAEYRMQPDSLEQVNCIGNASPNRDKIRSYFCPASLPFFVLIDYFRC